MRSRCALLRRELAFNEWIIEQGLLTFVKAFLNFNIIKDL